MKDCGPVAPALAVADLLRNLVEQRQRDLVAGHFDVFWGLVKDQSGKLPIAAGEKATDGLLLGMNCFVERVGGTVPK